MTAYICHRGLQGSLAGRYYDAGDYVNFGLPMSFTTTLFAWSINEFGSSIHNQLENAKAAVRWGADYLLKAATATPATLYAQVRNSALDKKKKHLLIHSCFRSRLRYIINHTAADWIEY